MPSPARSIAVLALAACAPAGRPAPEPAEAWRAHVGCYRMEERRFALDSVRDLQLNADRPHVRRARFAPTAPIVGGYWYVTETGTVRVVRHDGLWGRSWEFEARGDTLVGQEHLRTDVPGQTSPPRPAVAVRTAACDLPEPGG